MKPTTESLAFTHCKNEALIVNPGMKSFLFSLLFENGD